jgi:DsbC/DsbD-like thiol-disulfide interchange protein
MMRTLPAVMGIVTGLLCGLLAAGQGNVSSQGRTYVEFEPLQTVTVKPGHSTPVEFTFHVKSGYHINSNQPSAPELIPTQLHFTLPGEIVIAKVQYPAGQLVSFPFDPTQKLSVYSGDVTIRAIVIAPQGASPGALTVHGELKYQACDNNACYPPKKLPVEFDVKVASAGDGNRPRPKR